jgi:hypothetical protein
MVVLIYKVSPATGPLFDQNGLAVTLIVLGALLLPRIFYLMAVHKAIARCSPPSRSMSPGLVWLSMVPIIYLFWDFVVVFMTSSSLDKEYKARSRPLAGSYPGLAPGIAFCVLNLVGWIPFLNLIIMPVSLILWIIFWVKMARLSRGLD